MGDVEQRSETLYLKYRGRNLDDIVGQDAVVRVLKQAIKKNRLSHAYLFTGPRGVGKTSIARILAHEITGLDYNPDINHIDIIEIDAASNRRIDDIRELRDKARIMPTQAKYKVYIIDEVHMLTGESFNAFLKILEEPPQHVIFILATTDAHKLPATITSRTQRFSFRSISPDDAFPHLKKIAKLENIAISDEALKTIATQGKGSFRDSIGLLDQLSSLSDGDNEISDELVRKIIGVADISLISILLESYSNNDSKSIIDTLRELKNGGTDSAVVAEQLIDELSKEEELNQKQINLLDNLLLVSSSSRPDIKLLISLLEDKEKTSPAQYKVSSAQVSPQKSVAIKEVKKASINTKSVEAKQERVEVKPARTQPEARNLKSANDLWKELINCAKKEQVALSSILTKCHAKLGNDTIYIYTKTNFWKKKLDSDRYRSYIHEQLDQLGYPNYKLELIPTEQPASNEMAAAVVEIMGGGSEIELEEEKNG